MMKQNELQKTTNGISGCVLKVIAMVSMLIDHTAAVLIAPFQNLTPLYIAMRVIGRLAFPIYCFLLVEGFYHTRNRKKYAGRLFLFALISEIPFDLAFNQKIWDFSYNNVFFTLLIGLLVIWGTDASKDWVTEQKFGSAVTILRNVLTIVILCAGCFLAAILNTDYSAVGILVIFAIYTIKDNRLMGSGVAIGILGILAGFIEFVALLDLIPIYFYNGTRGKQIKYFFYAFYPVHLLILAGIAMIAF